MSDSENPIRQFEHAYYIGNYMSGILYGVELFLYFLTLRKLRKPRAGSAGTKRFYAIYSTIALVLLTIDISCNAVWGELMWIEGRELPQGVLEFFMTQVSAWYQTFGSTTVVALIFMGDALLLHRLFIIYGSRWLIMIIPVLVYLAGFALAIIQLVVAGKPGGNFFGGKSIDFGTPYYAITIGLNVIVTAMIWVRLHRLVSEINRINKFSTRISETLRMTHTGVLIESAALYSMVGIMFLVPYAEGSQSAIGFGQVWAKLTCICPQMIIYRMASGRAWTRERITEAQSTIVHPPPPSCDIERNAQSQPEPEDYDNDKKNSSTSGHY